MRAPAFWEHDGRLARLLALFSIMVAEATARRVAQPAWRASVPVICCGNPGVGGAGKTILALDLGTRLRRRGGAVAFITRGYCGTVRGNVRVSLGHEAVEVGDEAMLLSAVAPTYVGADREASARMAIADGATVLLMDDGLQNANLAKDLSLLVIDGGAGFGNGRVLPAGPLREPVHRCAARCRAAVLIGPDARHAAADLPAGFPVLNARLVPDHSLDGRRVFAFAGIGRPAKFFASVREAGADLVGSRAFGDHCRYSEGDLTRLARQADRLGAQLVTTAKDAARLPAGWRSRVLAAQVSLEWSDPALIEALLSDVA